MTTQHPATAREKMHTPPSTPGPGVSGGGAVVQTAENTMKRTEIKIGDLVNFAGTPRRAQIAGRVLQRGRVNFTIECTVRFSPTGPWYRQEHKLPICEVTHVIRDEQLIEVTA